MVQEKGKDSQGSRWSFELGKDIPRKAHSGGQSERLKIIWQRSGLGRRGRLHMSGELIYSETAERSVLSAAIINPGCIQEIDLLPEDFYVERNRIIWNTITSLSGRGIAQDYVTLTTSLEKQGRLGDIGGEGYLMELLGDFGGNSFLFSQYALSVKDYGRRRRVVQAAQALATAAHDLKCNLDERTEQVIRALVMDTSGKSGAVQISQAVSEFYDDLQERIANARDMWGIPTGFLDYDRVTGGLQDKDGEVLYIAGEPGVGKSIMSIQIGFNLAMSGIPGAIYSLEMKNRQVVRRLISAMMRTETRKLKTGRLNSDEQISAVRECERLAQANVFIYDNSILTIRDLRNDVARLKARYDIRWFVLDYLYLMSGGSSDEIERSAEFSRGVKQICKDYQVAGITVNSINKAGMDRNDLTKGNVRGSGQVIHDADVILLMTEHQPKSFEPPNKNLKTLTFAKGRDLAGPSMKFNLFKHDDYPWF